MSIIKTATLSNGVGTKEINVDTLVAGNCKVWVNFNGTGVLAINDSFNVSSITDNTTGDYTINFDVDFANANFVWVGTASDATRTNYGTECMAAYSIGVVGSQRVVHCRADNLTRDAGYATFAAFGDQ